MMNRKAIAGVLIVTIVVASIAIAVSAEGEGGVRGLISAKDIMPGAITQNHLQTTGVWGHAYTHPIYTNDTNTLVSAEGNDTVTLGYAYTNDTATLGYAEGNDTVTLGYAYTNDTTTLSNARTQLLVHTITVHNETGNFSVGTGWTDILDTSNTDYIDETSGETITPSVASGIIVIYSGNVTSAEGAIYVQCKIGKEDGSGYLTAIRNTNVKVGSEQSMGVTFTVPFFYDSLAAGTEYNVTISAMCPLSTGATAISNQTLVAMVIPT